MRISKWRRLEFVNDRMHAWEAFSLKTDLLRLQITYMVFLIKYWNNEDLAVRMRFKSLLFIILLLSISVADEL